MVNPHILGAHVGKIFTQAREARNKPPEERKKEQFLRDPDAKPTTFFGRLLGKYRRWKRNKTIQKLHEESKNFEAAKLPPDGQLSVRANRNGLGANRTLSLRCVRAAC